jgi:hypothetical protein
MKKNYLSTLIVSIFCCLMAKAQDTISVQAFHFKSSAKRDTMVKFPAGSHKDYEKILLQYTMRCKNALVSTATDRNKGCGEWDYSCNSYLTDSTKVDSILAFAPNYIISGIKDNFFSYVKKPTYNYTLFKQKEVKTTATNSEKNATIGNGTESILHPFVTDAQAAKAYYLIKSSEIGAAIGNKINGLEMQLDAPLAEANFLKIRLKETAQSDLMASNFDATGFTEVYFQNTPLNIAAYKKFLFHTPFTLNIAKNIIVEISYHNPNILTNVKAIGTKTDFASAAYSTENDAYVQLSGDGIVEVPTDSMKMISKEISIAFWAKGDKSLPLNTGILNANDDKNVRQAMIHLPWSDGSIYWDCGGDAAGFDRASKAGSAADFKDEWTFWTFSKNAATGSMKIYINGSLWYSATGKTKPINIKKMILGNEIIGEGIPYIGGFDDLSIWNKDLDVVTIKQLMLQRIDASHPNYANLVCHYNFNEKTGEKKLKDISKNNLSANFTEAPKRVFFQGREMFKGFQFSDKRLNIKLLNGSYTQTIINKEVLDSTQNFPNKVRSFYVENNDLKEGKTDYYWQAGDFDVLDESGAVVKTINVAEDSTLDIEDLKYVRRSPMKYELTSFVTPYGINLDLGAAGKTWYFDVTDLGPILNGTKRMTFERGGQNQEELDIRFLFIKGTPPRDVLTVNQLWPVTSPGYTSILTNRVFEERNFTFPTETKAAKIKSAITGHGQEGEFNRQTHYLNINGGLRELEWLVWKECANNPVYPQGGTWIYDRAGWCPGAPTDVKELDLQPFIGNGNTIKIDYGVQAASGDSRYIVNNQLVTYGSANFKNDAAMSKIIKPTADIEQGRFNPICMNPEVEIKNTGSEVLTSVDISYGVKGATPKIYTWKGSLAFLQTTRVLLPSFGLTDFAQSAFFSASVANPNGKADEYLKNNTITSKFTQVKKWSSSIIVQMRTNNFQNETSWELTDETGKVLKSRKNGLKVNTLYIDTLQNLNGCYQWRITDSDDDGLSFFANGDGNGSLAIKNLGGVNTTIQADFGKEINYQFIAGTMIATNDLSYRPELLVFPNPTSGLFTLQTEGIREAYDISVTNLQGQILLSQKITNIGELHQETTLDLSSFPSGMYIVQVKSGQLVLSQKIVKE